MIIEIVRLGRDIELRQTPKGDSVASLAMVYDVGWGDNKTGQWIEGTLWGARAEKLAPYLTKGAQIQVTGDDVQVEQYMKKDGNFASKMKCRITDIKLLSGSQSIGGQQQAPQQRQQQPPQQQAQNQQQARQAVEGGFDAGFDDDIPF